MAKDSTVEREAISKAGEVQALAFAKAEIASAFVKTENTQPITSAYMREGRVVKRLTGVHPNSVSMRAFGHMCQDHYRADCVQVYSTETGRLFCEMKINFEGKLETTFKADPTTFDDPLRKNVVRAAAFFM